MAELKYISCNKIIHEWLTGVTASGQGLIRNFSFSCLLEIKIGVNKLQELFVKWKEKYRDKSSQRSRSAIAVSCEMADFLWIWFFCDKIIGWFLKCQTLWCLEMIYEKGDQWNHIIFHRCPRKPFLFPVFHYLWDGYCL